MKINTADIDSSSATAGQVVGLVGGKGAWVTPAGSISVADGTNTEAAVTQIIFSGATVSTTGAGEATVTIVGGSGGGTTTFIPDVKTKLMDSLAVLAEANSSDLNDGANIDKVVDQGGHVAMLLYANTLNSSGTPAVGTTYTVPAGCVAVCVGGQCDDQIATNPNFYAHRLYNVTKNKIAAGFSGGGQNRTDGWTISRSGMMTTSAGGNPNNVTFPVSGVAGDVLECQAWTSGDGNYRVQCASYYLVIVNLTTGAVLADTGIGTSSGGSGGGGVTAVVFPALASVSYSDASGGSILAQTNVSSVVVLATGYYQINFSNPMPDTHYAVSAIGKFDDYNGGEFPAIGISRNTAYASGKTLNYVVICAYDVPSNGQYAFSFDLTVVSTTAVAVGGGGGTSAAALEVDSATGPVASAVSKIKFSGTGVQSITNPATGEVDIVISGGSGSSSGSAAQAPTMIQRIVGRAESGAALTLTLATAPTVGNIMVAIVVGPGGSPPSPPTGWQIVGGSSFVNESAHYLGATYQTSWMAIRRVESGDINMVVGGSGDNTDGVLYEFDSSATVFQYSTVPLFEGNGTWQFLANRMIPGGSFYGALIEHDSGGEFAITTGTPSYSHIYTSNTGANHRGILIEVDPNGDQVFKGTVAHGYTPDYGILGYFAIGNAAIGGATLWDFKPPKAAYFDTLFSGTGTNIALSNDADVGLLYDGGPAVAGDVGAYAFKTLTTPTAAWSMKAKMRGVVPATNWSGYGLAVQSTGNSKLYLLGMTNGGGVKMLRLTNTGYSGEDDFSPSIQPHWLRIDFDGATTITAFISSNGKNWLAVSIHSITDWLGAAPDKVGFGVDYNRNSGPSIIGEVSYFSLIGAAV